ncbi:cation transporter [Alicyclobacillus cycloheptanicus]|nr:cation transporter [Alicyclobacillus cycloheptanicus]
MTEIQRAVRMECVSIAWLVMEAVVALATGIAAHSVALASFGADSVIELISAAVLLWRLTVEARGAAFHRVARAERTASWVVGLALWLLALYILAAASHELLTQHTPDRTPLGLTLALASATLMPLLANAKRSLGERIGSGALKADAACSMVCAYMAWTVVGGVTLTALLNWWWADAVAALALIYFVVHEAQEALVSARTGERAHAHRHG